MSQVTSVFVNRCQPLFFVCYGWVYQTCGEGGGRGISYPKWIAGSVNSRLPIELGMLSPCPRCSYQQEICDMVPFWLEHNPCEGGSPSLCCVNGSFCESPTSISEANSRDQVCHIVVLSKQICSASSPFYSLPKVHEGKLPTWVVENIFS